MKDTKLPKEYVNALNRLKQGSTWQAIANHLTKALDDGRTVFKAEVWKMSTQGKWSPKVAQGLLAAGDVPGPRKRFRLHAEFQSIEQMHAFMDYYSINSASHTFTEWAKDVWYNDQYPADDYVFGLRHIERSV